MISAAKSIVFSALFLFTVGGAIFWIYALGENRYEDFLKIPGRRDNSASVILENEYGLYTNTPYAFSVAHPKDLVISTFSEEWGYETIVFQHPEKHIGFQVTVSPQKESYDLKKGDILNNFSFLENKWQDIQEIAIGEGIPAFSFNSYDELIGETREVRFSHNGRLYIVITYDYLASWLEPILSTWRFLE